MGLVNSGRWDYGGTVPEPLNWMAHSIRIQARLAMWN